ncbi:MAG: hypothetical protein Kow0099_07950 [Candidatus Abyssubacteria bacterium]
MKTNLTRRKFLKLIGTTAAGTFLLPGTGLSKILPAPRDPEVESLLADLYTGLNLYWGDVHGHTGYSDGYGFPSECYEQAKYARGLDFTAVTDHAEFISHFARNIKMNDGSPLLLWNMSIEEANQYNAPGEFVTLIGYEWTSNAYGHRCVYFRDDQNIPQIPISTLTHKTPAELWSALESYSCFTVPHHCIRPDRFVDWSYTHDMERLVEIYSKWGNCESWNTTYEEYLYYQRFPTAKLLARGHDVASALMSGIQLGMIGGTDSHQGLTGSTAWDEARGTSIYGDVDFLTTLSGEEFLDWLAAGNTFDHREPRPSGGGLCGVWTDELHREKIWNGMYARRTLATSGIRPFIRFAVIDDSSQNYALMGGDMVVGEGSPKLLLHVIADPDSGIENIEIRRNMAPISCFSCYRAAEVSGALLDVNALPGNRYFYSLKICFSQNTNTDGDHIIDLNADPPYTDDPQLIEVAWPSPIWVTRT